MPDVTKPPQIFLSYASSDRAVAQHIVTALQREHIPVWFADWEILPGDSISERIDNALSSADVLLVLLSRNSIASRWIEHELSTALTRELRDRAITVMPALIEDCEVPIGLRDRVFLDLRQDIDEGIQRLLVQLRAVPNLEFSTFNGETFENLVVDLLGRLGFEVEYGARPPDSFGNLLAAFRSRDPFGAERCEMWLVKTKLYREQRVNQAVIRQLSASLGRAPRGTKGLLVTNGSLTSVLRDYVAETKEKEGYDIRVIDRVDLTGLLVKHPELVARYFPWGKSNV